MKRSKKNQAYIKEETRRQIGNMCQLYENIRLHLIENKIQTVKLGTEQTIQIEVDQTLWSQIRDIITYVTLYRHTSSIVFWDGDKHIEMEDFKV